MKKVATLGTISLLLFLSFLPLASAVMSETHVSGHSIVIDAGHGGSEGGSLECPGLSEADANLDIAYLLKDLLEPDATVHMTRTDYDETLSNRDRYEFANSTDGEVLVSIHLNGSSDNTVDGSLGLYGKKNKDEQFTQVMHDVLYPELNNFPDFQDFGITNFASGVLLKSDMPATIQEAVFISDTDECEALKTGARKQDVADALYKGLNEWFSLSDASGGGDDDGGSGGNGNSGGPKCDSPPCNNK